MKKMILILSLTISMTLVHAQAVLEHVYHNQAVNLSAYLSNYGWVYEDSPYAQNAVRVYSSSHVLLKTIPLYIPSGYQLWTGIQNTSDILFNSDDKIEILYTVIKYSPISYILYLLNEDGTILQEFQHQGYTGIYNINGDFKLVTWGDLSDSNSYIYSLPGTMVDVPPQSTELELTASPNPCKDVIEISHPINAVRIRIISVEGKEVYRVNTGMALSTKVQTMALPTGTYIYEVTLSDQRKLTGKFIKQ